MRFLADMGLSEATVAFLREEGHDAMHLREQGLQRMPDPGILQKAREEERIILEEAEYVKIHTTRQKIQSCPIIVRGGLLPAVLGSHS